MNGEPVKIRFCDREVPVEMTPVASSSSSHRTHVLVRPQEHLLILRPGPTLGVFVGGTLLVSIVAAVFGILGAFTSGGWAPWVVLGVAVLVALLALLVLTLPRTHVFDLRQGTWTRHGLFARTQHPLREILAVQMNPGKPMRDSETSPGSPGQPMYELNLGLEGEPLRRLCLTCHGEGAATWQTGHYLAHALRRPFLQQAPRPPAAPAPAPAASLPAPAAPQVNMRLFGWVFAGMGM